MRDRFFREVLVGRGDVTLADDPQLGTLRSTCAEVAEGGRLARPSGAAS